MSELRELYQTVILDHNKQPRNSVRPPNADRHAHGDNPLCGDKIDVYVELDDGTIRDIGFVGSGCAISQASASLMTENVKGRSVEDVNKLFDAFHEMVTASGDGVAEPEALGKLAVFEGVREYPMRVKCATLAWHTLRSALGTGEAVSTE